jgi:muramoyltetrapeptide carboxypeptidase
MDPRWVRYDASMALFRPTPIKPTDTIGVIAPGGPITASTSFDPGLAVLGKRYTVKVFPHVRDINVPLPSPNGYLAGQDVDRGADLLAAIQDPTVKAIICARGGYGVSRVFAQTVFYDDKNLKSEAFRLAFRRAIKANPKWIVGFSDITALHLECLEANVMSIHGPMVIEMTSTTAPDLDHYYRLLETPNEPCSYTALDQLKTACGGRSSVRGKLVGGNLTLLQAMFLQTTYTLQPNTIIAVEEDGEANYRIDRMLMSLKRSLFTRPEVVGILFGEFTSLAAGVVLEDVKAAVQTCIRDLNVPAWWGGVFGHGDRNLPFVEGAEVEIINGTMTSL